MCGKADKKNAQAVSKAMVDLLLGAKALSVTPDRGKGFARHADITGKHPMSPPQIKP